MRVFGVLLLAASVAIPAAAATFTVTVNGDGNDGTCDAHCSLREAITAANASAGPDVIAFAMTSASLTIVPTSQLPSVTEQVTIDGSTQTGWSSGAPVVGIGGGSCGSCATGGLIVAAGASDVVIRALRISGFSAPNQHALTLGGARGVLEGSWIGLTSDGTLGETNNNGVMVTGSGSTIGGSSGPATRNVFGANLFRSVDVGTTAMGTVIAGNWFGTRFDGTQQVFGSTGVRVRGDGTVIGGGAFGGATENMFAGSTAEWILVESTADGLTVQGNRFGIKLDGTTFFNTANEGIEINGGSSILVQDNRLRNANRVIQIDGPVASFLDILGNEIGQFQNGILRNFGGAQGATIRIGDGTVAGRNVIGSGNIGVFGEGSTIALKGNLIGIAANGTPLTLLAGVGAGFQGSLQIGGTNAGDANVITSAQNTGVLVSAQAGTVLLARNSIYGNTALGIDLNADGVSPNDAGDNDLGANGTQNFPDMTALAADRSSTSGVLRSAANTLYTVDVFATDTCDAGGHGEGRYFLGDVEVMTDAMGNAPFMLTLGTSLGPTQYVTTTARRNDTGATSEHSACLPGADVELGMTANSVVAVGQNITWDVEIDNEGPFDTGSVSFTHSRNAGQTFVSATTTKGSCSNSNSVTTCTIGALAVDESVTIRIVATVDTTGTKNATGQVLHDLPEIDPADNVRSTATPVNSPPAGVADAYEIAEDGTLAVAAVAGVLFNDTDPETDSLSAMLVSSAAHGTLTFAASGAFTYVPEADYHGPDSFTYRAVDSFNQSADTAVTVTVTPVNDTPSIEGDAFTLDEDTPLTVEALDVDALTVNDADIDGDVLRTEVVSQPEHGTLTLATSGTFTYVPDANFAGEDSFFYRVNDGVTVSTDAMVSFSITPINDAPSLAAPATPADGEVATFPVTFVWAPATDADGDPVEYRLELSGAASLSFETTATSFELVEGEALAGEYTWRVVAIDPSSAENEGTARSITLENPSSGGGSSGCGCNMTASSSPHSIAGSVLFLALGWVLRRRRYAPAR